MRIEHYPLDVLRNEIATIVGRRLGLTLYSIDVVDFAAASSDFKSVALQHTESIT